MAVANRHCALPLLAVAALILGCGGKDRSHGGNRSGSASKLLPDKLLAGKDKVEVWEIPVRQGLQLSGRPVGGAESAEAARQRTKATAQTVLSSRVLLYRDQRLAWQIPSAAAPGQDDSYYVVLQAQSSTAAIVNHRHKRFRVGSPAQIAAWVEGATRAQPPLANLDISPQTKSTPGVPDGRPPFGAQALRRLQALLTPKPPRTNPPARSYRYDAEIWAVKKASLGDAGRNLLWDFAFLPFIDTTAPMVLLPLYKQGTWPLRWAVAAVPQDDSVRGAGQRVWTRVLLESRRKRKVLASLLALPPPGYLRTIGPLTYRRGRTTLTPNAARPLRQRQPSEPRQPALTTINQSNRALLIHADGILVGWVAPRSRYGFRVLPAGYFRLSARSLLGLSSWRPRDTYVPGQLTLSTR